MPTLLLLLAALPASAQDISTQWAAARDEYRRKLEVLAVSCDERGLEKEAAITRGWVLPRDERLLYFHRLPSQADFRKLPDDLPAKAAEWHGRLCELRIAQADVLFALAQRAAAQGQYILAFQLLGETGRDNPDHAGVRAILGYERVGGQWLTSYEAAKRKGGFAWHAKYGWVPDDGVERYEKGERLTRGVWISAERDAQLHSRIETPWKIETEHFLVSTPHSLETAALLAGRLEQLHYVWRQLFAVCYGTESKLQAAFKRPSPVFTSKKRHDVVCFRNKEEYQEALSADLPPTVVTSGLYMQPRTTSYFYADGLDLTTVYHEATHQLFSEVKPAVRDVGRNNHFWVLEGVACYLESLEQQSGSLGSYVSVGGLDATRVQDARFYCLKAGFYVPLVDLAKMGMEEFQKQEKLARSYAQSTALVDFLLHADGGKNREALAAHLQAVYAGRDRPLPVLTGAGYPELDRRYQEFLQVTDAQLATLPHAQSLTYLMLAGTSVSDAGLASLKELPKLQSIDLSKTAITDAGLVHLARLTALREVDLTGTKVTDAGVAALQQALPGAKIKK
ncbi:MAG: DUF1570 domain-containing protein [Planctomycetia bacterium]|nr:DUF1570 domain-containing protein [Planctomycetia bacterium]